MNSSISDCYESDRDYSMGGIGAPIPGVSAPKGCQQLCIQNPACQFWTYVSDQFHQEGNRLNCYLKSSIVNNVTKQFLTSGPKYC